MKRAGLRHFFRRLAPFLLCGAVAGCGGTPATSAGELTQEREPADLLVFAPHPDDEALGCAGIVRQALAKGKRVKIALFTNGDGFPGVASLLAHKPAEQLAPEDYLALARFRQLQSLAALQALGGKPGDLVFLGYPDAGLDQVYLARGSAPFEQKFTRKSETYGPAQQDYHRAVHGRAASYTYASALADVVELIKSFRPGRVYVTSEADRHRDHQAAFRFVRDGIKAAGYEGVFETYLIHGGPEWPWPQGITPESRLEAHQVKGDQIPLGVPWPPPQRVPLSPEEARFKLAAIRAHATHLAGAMQGALVQEREYLESFVKSEEVFWPAVVK
jgi:LmbE family N-acetylglucosaminyl deacetylase